MARPDDDHGPGGCTILVVLVALVVGGVVAVSSSDDVDDFDNLHIGDCIGNVSFPLSVHQSGGAEFLGGDPEIVDMLGPDAASEFGEICQQGSELYELI